MPPRVAPSGSARGRGRGGQRGAAPRGGGGPALLGGPAPSSTSGDAGIPSHVDTVGVKRPSYGKQGKAITVKTNSFETTIPEAIMHHYDVISPSEKVLPAKLNLEIITRLQEVVAPGIFTPRVAYDGRKNVIASRELPFEGGAKSQEFTVPLASRGAPAGKEPKTYKVRLTKVAEINPEVLHRFIKGQQSHDNNVLTAITALNVIIRMAPTLVWPFNVRSFFTDRETKDIGMGMILWRGYFQSVRPGRDRMLINVDISTGTMFKNTYLLSICLEYLKLGNDPNRLANLPPRERMNLQRFIAGIRITMVGPTQETDAPRVVKKLSPQGAADLTFTMRDGPSMTVAAYFQRTLNKPLRFPKLPCVEVGSGALIPLERCWVPKGQIMRKQVPAEKTKDVLEFATKKPNERLESIERGLEVLAYGQSEYVRGFGLGLQSQSAMRIPARILPAPKLRYSPQSKMPTIVPRDGAWNMVDKKFISPANINRIAVAVYERQNRFGATQVDDMINGLLASCKDVGITVKSPQYIVQWHNGQGRIDEQLRRLGGECMQKFKELPTLIVVILPEGGNDIYTAVKHFGDIMTGVATQCLKSSKAFRAKPQYYANVCLKINVKLGGINSIPDPQSVAVLTDPRNPTIVMGADVIHPAPGSDGRPSFTSLVANVDSDTAKYIAQSRVQTSRQEMIADLQSMSEHVLRMYIDYRKNREKKPNPEPKRIIFYRDGVSEGQFKHVLEQELPLLEAACRTLKINPTITFIVVGKRHHVRFFHDAEKGDPRDKDKSGNLPAGTVVDQGVTSPVEFDFYLQSHGGLLGTSRPAHYNVLYDDNNFTPDGLQSLSFALCHVYARATRSVSIPAPVYYADIVCTRAKNHYDPSGGTEGFAFENEEGQTTNMDSSQANANLESYRRNFKPLHKNMERLMYFS